MRAPACLTVLVGALFIGAALSQPPPLPVVSDAVLERFAVACAGDPLIVPVTIQGKAYPFVVDTGCSKTVYDTSLKSLLGPAVGKVEFQTPTGSELHLDVYAAPEAFLGKLPLPRDEEVALFDLRSLRERGGQDVRGMLGMDFLENYVVGIDFDRGSLTFRRGVGDKSALGKALLMSSRQRIPYLPADLEGSDLPEMFEIDTGFARGSSGDLDSELFQKLVKAGKLRESAPGGIALTASGKTPIIAARLHSFTVGPFHHPDLIFSSPARGNTLGLSYWSR
jgi:hypothetical protein